MLTGQLYDPLDPELVRARKLARDLRIEALAEHQPPGLLESQPLVELQRAQARSRGGTRGRLAARPCRR
jgi:hypothetical protein